MRAVSLRRLDCFDLGLLQQIQDKASFSAQTLTAFCFYHDFASLAYDVDLHPHHGLFATTAWASDFPQHSDIYFHISFHPLPYGRLIGLREKENSLFSSYYTLIEWPSPTWADFHLSHHAWHRFNFLAYLQTDHAASFSYSSLLLSLFPIYYGASSTAILLFLESFSCLVCRLWVLSMGCVCVLGVGYKKGALEKQAFLASSDWC